jgi:tetratricopeptide (TPR) repeat protein
VTIKRFSAIFLVLFLTACQGGGGQAGFHNDQGIDALGAHRYEEARNSFKQALDINPNDAVVWANLGVALTRMESYTEALEAYEKSRELDAQDPVTVVEIAALHYRLGNYDAAETGYRQAIGMVKTAPEFRSSLALALLRAGKTTMAEEELAAAVEVAQQRWRQHALVRYQMAAFALIQGDTEGGLTTFEEALKDYPDGARMSLSDQDFDVLQDDPRYQEMVAGWWKTGR